MKMSRTVVAASVAWILAVAGAQATVLVTYAGAGVQTTSLGSTSVLNFNSLSTGIHNNLNWSGVGKFNAVNVAAADEFGGANNSKYSEGGLGGVTRMVLTLNSASSYFGMWLSAADAYNVVDFYSGKNGTGTLLAEFTTANLTSALSQAYYGNPNSGVNKGADEDEAFVYLNFFGTGGTAWGSVVFTDTESTSGFETDNLTSRVSAASASEIGASGTALESISGNVETMLIGQAPEPNSMLAAVLLGGLVTGGSVIRRLRGNRR